VKNRSDRGAGAALLDEEGGSSSSRLPIIGGTGSRYDEGMNFAAVLRETQGGGMKLPAPPTFETPAGDLAERARRALYEVSDPEFPISLVDLGLIYGVEAEETTGAVRVLLSFTATACPCMDFITWDVRERLLEEPDVTEVEIEIVWDPPWTVERISERGRGIMRRAGVSV
jgi:metal-sulfur cluster biosynthetic enzyme